MKAAITAIGGYVPEYVLTNEELATMVETNDEWITTRTGIKERRILKPEEGMGASYLAIKAVEAMKNEYGVTVDDVDLVILASVTPDMPVAITSAYIAQEIGATNAYAFDLQAACSSFLYAVSNAAAYIESGKYKKVLVVGSDVMSSIVDYTDRTTCILFGDGCGVVLMEPNHETSVFKMKFLEQMQQDAISSALRPEVLSFLLRTRLSIRNNMLFVKKDRAFSVLP